MRRDFEWALGGVGSGWALRRLLGACACSALGSQEPDLSSGGGIFAAVTAFVGIWGMNFKYMPELDWEYGYPAALTFIVVVIFFLYWRFKKAGWL